MKRIFPLIMAATALAGGVLSEYNRPYHWTYRYEEPMHRKKRWKPRHGK